MMLTEKSVLSLAQSALAIRASFARHTRETSRQSPLRMFHDLDLHKTQVLLTHDNNDVPTTFALPIVIAKPLAEKLPAHVAAIEAAIPNRTRQ